MARFDRGEACCLCLKFINPGQRYVRAESKVAHYRCAKKRGWKRKSRAKPKPKLPEVITPTAKIIKVVRNGLVIKKIEQ